MTDTLPHQMTIGEAYGPAMKITDQAEADEYFERLVERAVSCEGMTREGAERQERSNLGYYARYYSNETRARIETLFRCAHPGFGPISGSAPSVEEALEMGRLLAEDAASAGEDS